MGIDSSKAKGSKRLAAVLVAVCVLGGGVWFWDAVVEDRVIPKRFYAVPGHNLYRSGQLSAALVKRTLTKHGIQVIVALTHPDPQDKDQQAEERVAAELGIELRRFPLTGDGTGDVQQYAGALAAVIEAGRQGKTALVHCAAGAQRTGGTIVLLRLLVDKKEPAEVVQELRRYGWKPRRNPHLLPYLNENLARLAAILHEQGLLEEIPDPLPVLHAM